MKKIILLFLLSLSINNGFAQNRKFDYKGRNTPTFNIDKINEAQTLKDICPLLWLKLAIPNKISKTLDSLKRTEFPLGYYANAPVNYDMLVDYYSVEIIGLKDNKQISAMSNSDILSPEQKQLISKVEIGSDLKIVVKFKIKSRYTKFNNEDIINGFFYVSIVPSKEASFVGGFSKFSNYINTSIFDKCSNNKEYYQLSYMKIKFTIDKNGEIKDPKIIDSSNNTALDNNVIKALQQMPKWKAAQTISGIKVNQTFEFIFGNDGC